MVDNIWSEFARNYDSLIPHLGCYRRQVAKLLRDTQGAAYVIDGGCGTGLVSERLVARGQRVVGFDNNPAMLALAHERQAACAPEARARWRVLVGSVERFPEEVPHEADAVVLNNVLFYVRDVEAALRQCHAWLKPGGVLVATGPRQRPDMFKVMRLSLEEWKAEGVYGPELQAAVDRNVASYRKLTTDPNEMVTFFQPEELVARLRALGFSQALAADGDDYFGENYYVCVRK